MSHLIKVFLHEDALAELRDQFLDKESDLDRFIFEQTRVLARSAKQVKLNKQFSANIEVDGLVKQENFTTKEHPYKKFQPLKEDSAWIPEKMIPEETKTYQIKVGEKTWDYLKLFSQIYQLRIKMFNDSIPSGDKRKKEKTVVMAVCLEELIHEQLIQHVMMKIESGIDKEFDEEFEEVNKPKRTKRT